jgi:RNA polymerase sigma-70 factor (ECF subfamily)
VSTSSQIGSPRATDGEEFERLTEPFRRELLAHCYRMLGSVDDAEDLVQETYLRAWRSFDGFEARSSLRTWLYRIATNACLTAVERRGRRPLPSDLGDPGEPGQRLAPAQPEIGWLQPIPDALLPAAADPAVLVAARSSVRLALVAALQYLPPRQRVVLILRDVLAWRAVEVADLLGTTPAAVHSTLQRARYQLARAAPTEVETSEPVEPEGRALLDRYVAAFEDADITALMQLLREDVVWEMPPFMAWFAGREAVGRFISAQVFGSPGTWKLVRADANGHPALAAYLRGPDGIHHAHAIQVLTVTAAGIARVVTFLDPGLFTAFDLPRVYGPAAVAA